jgi:hypothetical protein
MKKILFIAVLICVSCLAQSQIKGVDLSTAKYLMSFTNMGEVEETECLVYNKADNEDKYYFYLFANTPVGLKHCIGKIGTLMSENDLDFEKPNVKDNCLYQAGTTGFEDLSASLISGNSEIQKIWEVVSGWRMTLTLTNNIRVIMFVRPTNQTKS